MSEPSESAVQALAMILNGPFDLQGNHDAPQLEQLRSARWDMTEGSERARMRFAAKALLSKYDLVALPGAREPSFVSGSLR